MDVNRYWDDVVKQRGAPLLAWFSPDAKVIWPCTGECFTADAFVTVNRAYPGDWLGEVKQVLPLEDGFVTVVRVFASDDSASFHVTSFFRLRQGKIATLTEYWAEDGPPPQWRQEMELSGSFPGKSRLC